MLLQPLRPVILFQVSYLCYQSTSFITSTFLIWLYYIDYILTFIFKIVSKGISNHLMKSTSKRRRTKQEIKDQKAEEEKKEHEIQ